MPDPVANTATAERVSSALKTYNASDLSRDDLLALTARPRIDFASILDVVSCTLQIGRNPVLFACKLAGFHKRHNQAGTYAAMDAKSGPRG
jgi:hypothetical protein